MAAKLTAQQSRTGWTVRYDVGDWLTARGRTDAPVTAAHQWPTLRAAEIAANRVGDSCYTIRTYSRAYFARLIAQEKRAVAQFDLEIAAAAGRRHAAELARRKTDMNAIAYIAEQMSTDDDNIDRQSVRLANLYNNAGPAERNAIDDALICICGYSLKTVLENTHNEGAKE